MTIKIKKEKTVDVFNDPNWSLFDFEKCNEKTVKHPNISLFSLVSSTKDINLSVDELANKCIKESISFIYDFLVRDKNMNSYFFMAHPAWINPSVMARHKKLWKSLPDFKGVNFASGKELMFESEKGIRFAGLLEITESSFEKITEILRIYQTSSLIVLTKKREIYEEMIEEIFSAAFADKNNSSINWSNLSSNLCHDDVIFVRLSGSFDDREVALNFIMNNSLYTAVEKNF